MHMPRKKRSPAHTHRLTRVLVAGWLLSCCLPGCQATPRQQATSKNTAQTDAMDARLWAATARLWVPVFGSEYNQGVATWTGQGRFVTAAHVLCVEGTSTPLPRLGQARLSRSGGMIDSPFAKSTGGALKLIPEQDLAWITPAPGKRYPQLEAITVSQASPEVGHTVRVAQWSNQRGDYTRRMLTGEIVALSNEPEPLYFIVAGQAVQGDSGGPVINEKGELIGVLVGGSVSSLSSAYHPFTIQNTAKGFDTRSTRQSKWAYRGPYMICTRVQPTKPHQ